MGVQNPKKLAYLHDILDRHSSAIKKRKMEEEKMDPASISNKEMWKIPYKIIAFVQNRLFELEDNKKIVQEYDIMSWHAFKEILFNVYDHRIKYAAELNGGVNTSYCSLAEHILIFIIDHYPRRK